MGAEQRLGGPIHPDGALSERLLPLAETHFNAAFDYLRGVKDRRGDYLREVYSGMSERLRINRGLGDESQTTSLTVAIESLSGREEIVITTTRYTLDREACTFDVHTTRYEDHSRRPVDTTLLPLNDVQRKILAAMQAETLAMRVYTILNPQPPQE